MKISVDVECTPQEARAFLGLPDLTPVHDAYIGQLKDNVANGLSPELVEQLVRGWMPMGEAGMKLWGGIVEGLTGAGKR